MTVYAVPIARIEELAARFIADMAAQGLTVSHSMAVSVCAKIALKEAIKKRNAIRAALGKVGEG